MLAVLRAVVPTYHQLTVIGRAQLPTDGPAVIVANHTSPLDPLLIQTLTPRLIRWMCAREYTTIPGTAWLWRQAEVIPVARDGRDATALRAAVRVLRQGHLLGVFPEGRLQPQREVLPLRSGLSLLADSVTAPLVPVWVDGIRRGQSMLHSLLLPQRAVLNVGEPWRPQISGARLLDEVASRLCLLRDGLRDTGWSGSYLDGD